MEFPEKIELNPIGVVHTEASDERIKSETEMIRGVVEIFPEYEDALKGLDGYSHLFIISHLHKLRSEQIGPLQVKPKRATRRGFKIKEIPLLGVLALDSPTRPNPLGLTLVRFLRRDHRKIFVSGLDLFDGTPVVDLKPYQSDYRTGQFDVPSWYQKLMDKTGHL